MPDALRVMRAFERTSADLLEALGRLAPICASCETTLALVAGGQRVYRAEVDELRTDVRTMRVQLDRLTSAVQEHREAIGYFVRVLEGRDACEASE